MLVLVVLNSVQILNRSVPESTFLTILIKMLRFSDLQPLSKLSNYARTLPRDQPNIFKRYLNKIQVIGFRDPYAMDMRTSELPKNVRTGSVIDYLINFRSPYTGEYSKNSRSLEGYRKFEGGFVHSVRGTTVGDFHVVIGKVFHSMRLNESLLSPWVIVGKDGNVVSAHCTCIAGCSETCSHVSAILYYLANFHAMSNERKITVTDQPAYWRQPPKKVRDDLFKEVGKTDYGKSTKRFYDMPTIGKEKFDEFLLTLRKQNDDAVILNRICDNVNITCRRCQESEIPYHFFKNTSIFLQANFDVRHENRTLDELRDIGRKINLKLTDDLVTDIEKRTRDQRESDLWRWLRIGRITASILKEAISASYETPPDKKTLIKKICHPYLTMVDSAAMAYGRRNEVNARRKLETLLKEHQDLIVSDSGLFISPSHPFLAGTPDAIGSCVCCGKFAIELKCPYRLDRKSPLDEQLLIKDLCDKPNSFIKINADDSLSMVETHKYYYQLQAQIFLSNSDFGLFMVWSKKESVLIRVEKDLTVWIHCVERSQLFFYNIILPELLGNYFPNRN